MEDYVDGAEKTREATKLMSEVRQMFKRNDS